MARVDPRRWSLAAQIFALQVLVAVLVVGAGVGAAYLQARRSSEHQAADRVLAIAHTVAASPEVVAAVGRPRPDTACCSRSPSACAATPAPTSSW